MHTVVEQKQKILLARPRRQKHLQQPKDHNIFAALRSTEPLPSLHKIRGKSYDFVGSSEFKQKYTQSEPKLPKAAPQHQQSLNQTEMRQNMTNSNMMNTTINRNTMMSKMTRQQTNILTREVRQLNRYQEYQDYWNKQSKMLHKKTLRNPENKTLLQENVKDLYAQPNQDRMDIINTFVVNMWEMSLRNNNKILQRHIKGHKYEKNELEVLLQTDRGITTVERSIPVLPIDKLKQLKKRELSLTGRNKALSQTHGSGAYTQRKTNGQTPNQQQVYKISYSGNVKWMSTQGL